MQETWVRYLGCEDPLKKGPATHSSTLAWRIPWIEDPGRLQPTGLQRVGPDSVTFIFTLWQFDIDIHYERISLIKLINTSVTSHSYSFFGEMITLDKRIIHQSMNNLSFFFFFPPYHQVRWNREAYQYTLRRSFKNNFQNAWGILSFIHFFIQPRYIHRVKALIIYAPIYTGAQW